MICILHPAISLAVVPLAEPQPSTGYGDNWKRMDESDLYAYIGLLILAGVYRSRGEATCSLWDAESGRVIFHATMPLKVFHTFSIMPRFDNGESRPARCVRDKLAAIREVWEKWVEP